jgi:hypothetical protein
MKLKELRELREINDLRNNDCVSYLFSYLSERKCGGYCGRNDAVCQGFGDFSKQGISFLGLYHGGRGRREKKGRRDVSREFAGPP